MSSSDLESEFARVSLGLLPASAIPKTVMHQIDFVNWDHQIFPGLIWRIPDPSLPEIRYHDARMIEGLKVQDFEKVVVLIEEKIRAVIPNGDWIIKREAGMKEERGSKIQKMELIWVDKRQFETSRRIPNVRSQDGAVDLDYTLLFKITDPAILVRNLILDEGKYLEKDIDQKIHESVEEVVVSELSKYRAADLSMLVESMKDNLNKEMNNWGMEAIDLKISSILQTREQIQQVPREPTPSIGIPKIPQRATAFRNTIKREQQTIMSRNLSPESDWESATKKWIPQSKRGEMKCDGCSNDVDWYAECDQKCRSSGKCKLCKECYLKRKICAFV